MSVAALLLGGIQNPVTVSLATTSRTTIYTAEVGNGNARTIVLAGSIINEAGSATTVTLEWSKDGVVFNKFYKKPVSANDTVFIDQLPVMLRGNGTISATASAGASVVTVTLSIMQDSGALGGMLRAQV